MEPELRALLNGSVPRDAWVWLAIARHECAARRCAPAAPLTGRAGPSPFGGDRSDREPLARFDHGLGEGAHVVGLRSRGDDSCPPAEAVSGRRQVAGAVAAWLAGIVINLFSYGEWHDIAVRDFGLMAAAFVLGRLASVYDPPLRLRR